MAPNLLQQDFSATAPNQKFVGDITYLWTDEGWLYHAIIIDLYSRLVVGWAMSERMTAQLVCDALNMVSDSPPERRCDKQYSSTLKWTTIEPADTAPMAISARKRLRQMKSLNDVSTVGGQDQTNSGSASRRVA